MSQVFFWWKKGPVAGSKRKSFVPHPTNELLTAVITRIATYYAWTPNNFLIKIARKLTPPSTVNDIRYIFTTLFCSRKDYIHYWCRANVRPASLYLIRTSSLYSTSPPCKTSRSPSPLAPYFISIFLRQGPCFKFTTLFWLPGIEKGLRITTATGAVGIFIPYLDPPLALNDKGAYLEALYNQLVSEYLSFST